MPEHEMFEIPHRSHYGPVMQSPQRGRRRDRRYYEGDGMRKLLINFLIAGAIVSVALSLRR